MDRVSRNAKNVLCCAKRMLFPVSPPEERVKRRIGGSSRRSLARRTLSRVSPIHSRTIEAENKVRKKKIVTLSVFVLR